jgi:hypothetical protein
MMQPVNIMVVFPIYSMFKSSPLSRAACVCFLRHKWLFHSEINNYFQVCPKSYNNGVSLLGRLRRTLAEYILSHLEKPAPRSQVHLVYAKSCMAMWYWTAFSFTPYFGIRTIANKCLFYLTTEINSKGIMLLWMNET